MTANAMASDRILCLEAGMNDHIAKPIDPDQLFGVLLRWIRRADGDGEARATARAAHASDEPARAMPSSSIPGIDVRAGLEADRRQSQALRDAAAQIRRAAEPERRDAIEAALSEGDAATAERAAHSLKGAAATLGANALSEAAARGRGRDQEREAMPRRGPRRLSLALDTVLAGPSRRSPRRDRRQRRRSRRGDPASVQEPLARLKQLLETDDGEAADFIVDAKPRLAGVLTPAEIKTLTDRVGKFDFDAALKCLSGIASRLSLNLEGQVMSGPDKKLVLIVDDTPTNVAVVSGVLKDSFRTKVATNGEKALAIATGAEKPDLILLDVMMPGMDGYEVCRQAQGQSRHARHSHHLPHRQDRGGRRGEGLRRRRGRLHPQAVLRPDRAGQGQDPARACRKR